MRVVIPKSHSPMRMQKWGSIYWENTDASHPISGLRLSQILSSFQPITPQSPTRQPLSLTDVLSNLTYFSTPSLAHLIALLAHPTQTFPPPNTSLIIIDSFSTLISSAFPRNVDVTATPKKPNGKLLTFYALCQLTISQHQTPQPENSLSSNISSTLSKNWPRLATWPLWSSPSA